MTFAAFETTDGSPIELITFENGAITHRYSNTVLPYTVGINTFEPLAYSRNKFSQSKDSDDNNITLNVPAEIEIAALYNGVLTSNMTFCPTRLSRAMIAGMRSVSSRLRIFWKRKKDCFFVPRKPLFQSYSHCSMKAKTRVFPSLSSRVKPKR